MSRMKQADLNWRQNVNRPNFPLTHDLNQNQKTMTNPITKTGGAKFALALTGSMTLLSIAELKAQTTPAPMPGICNRACWGARAPACQPGNISALTRAIVHHTAGTGDWTTDYEASKGKIRTIQNGHIDVRGFCD